MSAARLIVAAVVMISATVALLVAGLEPLFALGGGILAAAGVIALALRRVFTIVDDGPGPDGDPPARGSEISRLAWGFNPRTDVAGEIVARRVRAVLRRRLARIGIDIDDPAARQRVDDIVGHGRWDRLTSRQATRADIDSALDHTERLRDNIPGRHKETP